VTHIPLSRETMKSKVNKSELIRGIIAKNPSAKAPEVRALLKKDGFAVSLPLVYQAMRKDGSPTKKAAKRGRPKRVASATKTTASSSSTNDLFASMQSFVNAAGGLDKAIEILSVFKK
jgi:hypothetical protein